MIKSEYRTILMDPPWLERGAGKIKRGADRHYPLLKPPEILAVILQSGIWNPAPACHLYCWVTNNHLEDGLWLVKALGFRYITLLTWAKDSFGLGQYFRGQTEQLIFGVKGRLPAQVKDESTLMTSRRGRHSAKPEEGYAKIERVSPPPRLEMFARTQRPGWDCWGNEANGGLF
ncbi:MAG: MT-A70 family methyltransferase [Thermodesulfobacteriota bacterium]|nr:MT-A70 family methyltransferase [Thermodesulfobacteriota bacterium]